MSRKFIFAAALLALLAFFIPIEHKYDKLLRFYALTLAPKDLFLSPSYEQKFYLYPSDVVSLVLLSLALFSFKLPLRKFFGHPIWILFLSAFFSILISPYASYLIPYTRLLQLLTPLLLFSFIRTAFTDEERKTVTQWIWIALFSAALFQAAVAIAQYATQGPVGLRILSESKEFSAFDVASRSRWIFDHWISRLHTTSQMIRAQGTMPHANPFGGFVFLSILITYGLILKHPKKKWLFGLSLPFLIFAMALSFSRSALFAWIIATIVWFCWIIQKEGWKNKEVRFIALIVLLSASLTTFILYEPFSNRGGIVNYNPSAQGSDEGRLSLQVSGIEVIKHHPFLGVGYSLFTNQSKQYLLPNAPDHVQFTVPHNIFLLTACETGLLSFFALLLTILHLLWRLIKIPATLESITLGALFVGFLFISLCDFYPIFYQQGKLMFFLIMGLIGAIGNKINESLPRFTRSSRPHHSDRVPLR